MTDREAEERNDERIYVDSVIGEEYKNWNGSRWKKRGAYFTPGDCVYIDAATGTGKTTFIFEKLAPYAAEHNEKILYLCNRLALTKDVKLSRKTYHVNNIDIMTYQGLENIIAQSKKKIDYAANVKAGRDPFQETDKYMKAYNKLGTYKYIVADEIHYFLEDSDFNKRTYYSHRFLMQKSPQVKILISATGHFAIDRFNRFIKYRYVIPRSNIENIRLQFYRDDAKHNCDFAVDKILEIINTTEEDKVIFFVNSIKRMKDILEAYPEIKEQAVCMFSQSQSDPDSINNLHAIRKVDDELITFIDKRILIATSVLSNGVTMKDRNIKHIICEIEDVMTAIQCIGRKRYLDAEDICNIYVRYQTANGVKAKKEHAEKQYAAGVRYHSNPKEYGREIGDFGYPKVEYFVVDWHNQGKVQLNYAVMEKHYQDSQIYQKITDFDNECILNGQYDYSYGYAKTFELYSGLKPHTEAIYYGLQDKGYDDTVLALIRDTYLGKEFPAKGVEVLALKAIASEGGFTWSEFLKLIQKRVPCKIEKTRKTVNGIRGTTVLEFLRVEG